MLYLVSFYLVGWRINNQLLPCWYRKFVLHVFSICASYRIFMVPIPNYFA
eukprot:UN11958